MPDAICARARRSTRLRSGTTDVIQAIRMDKK
jgi:hypothetical protein